MIKGKVGAALQLLNKGAGSAPMRLDDILETCGKSVHNILKDKHPHPMPLHTDVILTEDITAASSDFHPVLFDSITAEVIRRSALLNEGSAGLSGNVWTLSVGDACALHSERNPIINASLSQHSQGGFAPPTLTPQL